LHSVRIESCQISANSVKHLWPKINASVMNFSCQRAKGCLPPAPTLVSYYIYLICQVCNVSILIANNKDVDIYKYLLVRSINQISRAILIMHFCPCIMKVRVPLQVRSHLLPCKTCGCN
jgi:hypothetical protein